MNLFGGKKKPSGKPATHESPKAPEVLEKDAKAALSAIIDRRTGKDVLTGGFITSLNFREQDSGTRAIVTAELPGGPSDANSALLQEIETALRALPGISSVSLITSAHREKPVEAPAAAPQAARKPAGKFSFPDIRHIIAIASGKGGVGKSTLAANLAVSLARQGLKTGLMDADITGPSIPTLFGLDGKPEMQKGMMVPGEAHGVKCMSIGMLTDPETAIAWRGPMVMGAIVQLLQDVNWGSLDILLIDTPPGTSDAMLTLTQRVPLTGAVIVSTPQEMALADVRRGVSLFRKMEVPVLGLVENMAWLKTPDGEKQYLFGKGGAEQAATDLAIPFLGPLPLLPDLRAASDEGRFEETGEIDALAKGLLEKLTP